MKYIVVKKHISNYPNPITLRKGEKVIVGKKYVGNENWSNWIYCFKLDKSQEGWVPEQILDDNIIKEDYTANELNVDEGEILIGTKELNGWLFCCDKMGNEGWVPKDNLILFDNIEYRTTLDDISIDDLKDFFVGWKKPLTNKQHYEILKNSEFFVLAYDTENKKVVGFINALSDKIDFAFIPMLEVLPEYQNKGIGSNLLKIMLNLLDDITCIDLTCDPDMQSYYGRFGMIRSHGMVIRKYY